MTRDDIGSTTEHDAQLWESRRAEPDTDAPTLAECDRDEAELIREALAAPCNMLHEPPMDFAWCETHDETFPLGAVCSFHRRALEREAISARANGHLTHERLALDALALDERARSGS